MKTETRQSRRSLPISVYQRRYWSKWARDPRSSSFNTSIVFVISGGVLDKEALKQACDVMVQTHEILHATFSKDGSEQYYSGFGIEDFYTEREGVGAETLDLEVTEILNRPFDLESGPLIRFYLLDCGAQRYYFVANAHHILADAASAKIFLSGFMAAYASSLDKARGPTPAAYSYADCIDVLHASQTAEKEAAARAFWKELLEGTPLTVAFPRKETPIHEDHSSESIYFELDGRTTEALRKFARDNGSTLFVVLFALYGLLLSRYARQSTVVISYPVNMRPQGYAHVLGCFVNLLVMKVAVLPDTTFRTLVDHLTRQRSEAKPHMFYQLGNIVHQQGDVSADIERSFFSVFFGETHLAHKSLSLGDLRVELPNVPWSQEFDRELRLLYDPSDGETIRFRMDFRTTLFDRAVILKLIDELRQMSGRLVDDERPLWQVTG